MKWEKQHQLTETVTWIGIDEQEMRPYQSYVNRKNPGICGAYAAAVLTDIVAKKMGVGIPDVATLIGDYEPIIEQLLPYPGSYYWDVQRGLNRFWKSAGVKSHFSLFSERVVCKLLNQQVPVIVGTSRLLGNSYGNHWVVVYAYAMDSHGKLWYKAYDNHGSIHAVIPAVQTLGAIWLSKL